MSFGIRELAVIAVSDQEGKEIGLGPVGGGDFFQKKFDGLPDVFPQHARQIGLTLAGFFNAVEQAGYAFFDRLQRIGRQELPQAAEFLGPFTFIEPAVAFPFAPRLEVKARIDEPELLAVGEQAEAMAGASQKFEEA